MTCTAVPPAAAAPGLLRHVDVIAGIFWRLLLAGALLPDVRGGIIQPTSEHLYLKAGDSLHLLCEQKTSHGSSSKVVWSKAYTFTYSEHPGGRRLTEQRYITIDDTAKHALQSFTINQLVPDAQQNSTASATGATAGPRARGDRLLSGVRLVSELVKKDVTPADSGSYRCRLGVGGVSSTVNVTVVDITTKDALSEKANNATELLCTVNDQDGVTNLSVTWYRHGKPVFSDGQQHYAVRRRSGVTSVLRLERVKETDVGEYDCTVALGAQQVTLKQTANLYSFPHVKNFDRSHNIVAGHPLELICRAWGWPTPNITWYRDTSELTPDTDPRVWLGEFPGQPPSSRLIVDNMGSFAADRARYTCVATSPDVNIRLNASASVFVRVKGKLAALWPLLGLGLEVIVLCVIIIVYEMKRNKQRSDEFVDDIAATDARLKDSNKSKMAADGNSHANMANDHPRRRKDQ